MVGNLFAFGSLGTLFKVARVCFTPRDRSHSIVLATLIKVDRLQATLP